MIVLAAPAAVRPASRARRPGTLEIGPLSLNAYGLMIALGVRRRGVAVRAAVRGARHRHPRGRQHDRRLGRHRRRDRRPALPRGHRLGALRGRLVRRRRDLAGRPRHPRRDARRRRRRRDRPPSDAASRSAAGRRRASAPALPLAQAIGRWGNWFNQELYGRADHAAVGARDRRPAPAEPGVRPSAPRSTRRSSTSRCGTSLLCGAPAVDRPPVASCANGQLLGDLRRSATASAGWWVESLRIDAAHETVGLR